MSQADRLPRIEALPNGWRLVVLSETDSTNEELRRRAASGEAGEGLAVVAQTQTAGRGRRGRAWVSPPGNLYLSVRLDQGPTLAETAHLSLIAAVALVDALREAAPHLSGVRCKWPNDVLIGGAKTAGILLETDGAAVILGVGVNLAHFPPDTPYPATSLRAEGADLTPEVLARGFLRHLAACIGQWRTGGFAPFRDAWKQAAQGLGGPIVARLQSGEEVCGTFVDLDVDGALVMEVPPQGQRRILAGDVFFPARWDGPHP